MLSRPLFWRENTNLYSHRSVHAFRRFKMHQCWFIISPISFTNVQYLLLDVSLCSQLTNKTLISCYPLTFPFSTITHRELNCTLCKHVFNSHYWAKWNSLRLSYAHILWLFAISITLCCQQLDQFKSQRDQEVIEVFIFCVMRFILKLVT